MSMIDTCGYYVFNIRRKYSAGKDDPALSFADKNMLQGSSTTEQPQLLTNRSRINNNHVRIYPSFDCLLYTLMALR